jgi:hypothetical protein
MTAIGLYIGCGTDFEIMTKLPELNACIYIDSRPLTAYGELYKNNKSQDVSDIPVSKTYMAQFHQNARNYGFIKTSVDGTYPHVYRNYETSQDVYHYYNLSFPIYTVKTNYAGNRDELTKLMHQLKHVTHLIVIGYSPHYSVFKHIANRVCLIGDYTTVYKDDLCALLPYEHNKITNILQREHEQQQRPNLQSKIEKYIYFDKSGARLVFSSYAEFIYGIMLTPHTAQSLGPSLFAAEPEALDLAVARTRTHCIYAPPINPFADA